MGKKTRNYILELKNQALEDKATELKINNKNIDEYEDISINNKLICNFKCNCGEISCKSIGTILAKNGSGLVCKKCTIKNQKEKNELTKSKKSDWLTKLKTKSVEQSSIILKIHYSRVRSI